MTDNDMTVQDAQAMLEADRQQRSEAAGAALRAILAQHNCDLVAVPQLTADGRIVADIRVVAR
jgi:hypothetical protein